MWGLPVGFDILAEALPSERHLGQRLFFFVKGPLKKQLGGFKYFLFAPLFGKIPILTNMFQRGWNHQPDKDAWHMIFHEIFCEHFICHCFAGKGFRIPRWIQIKENMQLQSMGPLHNNYTARLLRLPRLRNRLGNGCRTPKTIPKI